MSARMDWLILEGALQVTVSLVPVVVAWSGVLISALAALVLVLRPAGPSAADGLLSFSFCTLLALCCPAALLLSIRAFDPGRGLWLPETDRGYLLMVVDGAAPAAALLVVGLGLLGHHTREGEASAWWRLVALPGPLVGLLGLAHGLYLAFAGHIPTLQARVPGRVHVGPPIQFEVTVREGWEGEPLAVDRESPGAQCADARAFRWGLEARREWCWEVGRDVGPSWLELAEGNRWTWVPTNDRKDHLLWIVPSRQKVEGPPVSVEIGAAEESDGATTHKARLVGDTGAEDWQLYAWNGDVYQQAPPKPAGERPRMADLRWAWTEGPTSTLAGPVPLSDCRLAWFAGAPCGCASTAAPGMAIAGPLLCFDAPGATTASTVTSLLTTVLTGGLVILDPAVETTWQLRSAVSGSRL